MKSFETHSYLFIIGLVSILGQVVILRELSVAFYGIELVYILSLGIWLVGTAIGAMLGRRSVGPGDGMVQTLLTLMALLLPADILFIRGIRKIMGAVSGGYLPFELQIAGMLIAVIPFSLLAGVSFRAAARKLLSSGGSLAQAYAVESAGGVLGGLLSTFMLVAGSQNLSAGLVCAVLALSVVSAISFRKRMLLQEVVSSCGLLLVSALFAMSGKVDRSTTLWNHPDMLESIDTPYGRVTVTARAGQVCVFENDALSYETETTDAEEFVQLATLQSNELKRVLVLGGGFQGIVSELLKLPVRKIDYVEINKDIIEKTVPHLPFEFRRALFDERVAIRYADPRRFSGSWYDAILIAMPEPASGQNNRFYTKEFFTKCSRQMTPNGLLAFAIPSAENLWTPQLAKRNGSISAALHAVFRHVVIIPGVTNIFIASNSLLTDDPAVLVDRFIERKIETRLVTPQYISYVYTNDRFREVNTVMGEGKYVVNSDMQPACYSYTISVWLSRFSHDFALPAATSFRLTGPTGTVVLLTLLIFLSIAIAGRRLAGVRRFFLMFLAGAAGMLSETVLLLNYQNRSGVLYQDIGILLMTFMAGLAVGAYVADRFAAVRPQREVRNAWLGVGILIGFALLNLAIYFATTLGVLDSLWVTALLLGLVGVFVSSVFAFVSSAGSGEGGRAMTWLYSADLIGGTAGSIAALLFLIPILGILTTSVIAAATAMAGLAFLE